MSRSRDSADHINDSDLKTETLNYVVTADANIVLTAEENLYGRIVITDPSVILTTSREVHVSTTPRVIYVQNDTAENLPVKTVAGTGKTVPAGFACELYCDGTNVIKIKDLNLPYTLVSNNTPQLIPSATSTKKTFDTVDKDAHGLWDNTNNQYVIPAAASVEIKTGNSWASNNVGDRVLLTLKNNAAYPGTGRDRKQALSDSGHMVSSFVEVAAGDSLAVEVYQASGAALNTGGNTNYEWFSVRVVEWL